MYFSLMLTTLGYYRLCLCKISGFNSFQIFLNPLLLNQKAAMSSQTFHEVISHRLFKSPNIFIPILLIRGGVSSLGSKCYLSVCISCTHPSYPRLALCHSSYYILTNWVPPPTTLWRQFLSAFELSYIHKSTDILLCVIAVPLFLNCTCKLLKGWYICYSFITFTCKINFILSW